MKDLTDEQLESKIMELAMWRSDASHLLLSELLRRYKAKVPSEDEIEIEAGEYQKSKDDVRFVDLARVHKDSFQAGANYVINFNKQLGS